MSHPTLSAVSKLGALFVAAVLGVVSTATYAEDYPSKPVTIVVPYPPGSTIDSVARMFQPILSESLKQPVVVENRGGASTNIGTEYVARSNPDGYTVLFQVPNIATNEFMFKGLRWKRDDFAPVVLLARWSNVLMAGPSAKIQGFKELLAAKDTASMNYGTPGVGSLSHLAVEMLKGKTDLALQLVTYTGTTPMITSLLGGHIQYGATNPANFMAYVGDADKKIVPMVVLGSQRDSTIPDVPSLADYKISGIDSYGWVGALVPAKTPPAVIARLNAEFMKLLHTPAIVEKLKTSYYLEPLGGTPEEFGRFIAEENVKWGKTIKAAGITME